MAESLQNQSCLRQCDSCAYGKSGGAAGEPANRLKSLICAAGLVPFFCHHGKDGAEYDWQEKESKLGPMVLAPANRKICAGWKKQVRRLKQRGYFSGDPGLRLIRKFYAKRTLALIENFIRKGISEQEKKELKTRLDEHCQFVFAKDISDLQIPL